MKLKYYLRGMGIGIILTAIVMGFALGGRKASLSDAEIIQRAKALGMVEAETGTLSETTIEKEEDSKDDSSASDQTLDQEGKEISEEDQQEVAASDPAVSEVAEEAQEGEAQETEDADASSEADSEAAAETQGTSQVTETVKTEIALENSETDVSERSEESVSETENADAVSAQQSVASGAGKTITIPGGMGSDQVAQILYNEGIIDNASTFNRYLIDRRIDRIIRSGTKVIPEGATYEEIANIITKG